MLAKHALSQLSYGPVQTRRRPKAVVVGLGGLEPPTSRLSSARSNQLSYKPGRKKKSRARPSRQSRSESRVFHILDQKERRRRRSPAKCGLTRPLDSEPDDKPSDDGEAQALRLMTSESRKEVIQPQVPLRLPCYDFTPVADPTVAGCLLAVSTPSSGKTNSHGVTGGVYKARERIHRGVLIRDY